MSLADIRTAIAMALSTVDGVTGYAFRPTSVTTGDGWPLLVALDRADGFTFTDTWAVLVTLPTDPRTATSWMDTRVVALAEALEPIGFVDRLAPLTFEDSTQQFLQITLRNE